MTTLSPPLHMLPRFLEMKYDFVKPSFVDYNTTQLHVDKSMHLKTTKHDLQTYLNKNPIKTTKIHLNSIEPIKQPQINHIKPLSI